MIAVYFTNYIENHSINCTKVKDEVMKIESSQFCFHVVDYRLKKLSEHVLDIQTLKKDNETLRDMHYFSTVYQYIEDAIDLKNINVSNLGLLKKIVLNVDVILIFFKLDHSYKF